MAISNLLCGGCKYCTKAHQNWTFFAQEIDDVVPLGMSIHSEIRIYFAFIRPVLEYGDVVWGNCTKNKKGIRFIGKCTNRSWSNYNRS